MNIGYGTAPTWMGGAVVKAHVSEGPDVSAMRESFDCARTIMLLRCAADALENGDGHAATRNVAEAWARLALFHGAK